MENQFDSEDNEANELRESPLSMSVIGALGLTALITLGAIYGCSMTRAKPQNRAIPEYRSLIDKVVVTAQAGDSLSGLMNQYSGFYPAGKTLYQWEIDNQAVSDHISAGKKYILRTTNTAERTSN